MQNVLPSQGIIVTNFGGASRKKGNNVFSKFKDDNPDLIGVGCPAHITNNCIHHGANQLAIDVEGIIFKIYQHFSIYMVRTEELKDYCDFVNIEYHKLLSHSRTRWFSLLPGINRNV